MRLALYAAIMTGALGCKSEPGDGDEAEGVLVNGVCVYPWPDDACPQGCTLAATLPGMRNANRDDGSGYELWRCGEGSSWTLVWWADPYLFEVYRAYYDGSGTLVATQTSYDYNQECGDGNDSSFAVQYGDAPACEAYCEYEASSPGGEPCVGGSAPPL